MSLFRKLMSLGVVGVFLLSMLVVPGVLAQDSGGGDGGSGLQITPTRTQISAQPGESKDFTITVKNVTNTDVTAQAFLNDFESDGVSGSPKILAEPDAEPTPYSLRNVLTSISDVDLKAGETKEVKHTLNLPADIAPGAYFGAIRYAAVPKGQQAEGDQKVSLTASVAHLVFLEVPGEVNQQIQLLGVEPRLANSEEKAKFYQKPASVAVKVKNLGNGFSQPFGKVIITRGSSEVYSYDINNTEPRGFVLPKSERHFVNNIDKDLKIPGKYKITASVAYGNGGETVNYTSTFWYLPLWFLGALVVVLAALGTGGWMLYRRMMNKK